MSSWQHASAQAVMKPLMQRTQMRWEYLRNGDNTLSKEVDKIIAAVRELKVTELLELSRHLKDLPLPTASAGGSGAKPKTPPPTLSAGAKARRRR